MRGIESKSQSLLKDNQIMAENSICPAEYVEGLQQCVKEILNLIEQDGNFSEMTSEIYDCEKSKLTTLVTNLSHMHGMLADHLSKKQHVDSSDSSSPQVTHSAQVREKCHLIDDLNHKHDAVMSDRDGVKAQLDTLRAMTCLQESLIKALKTGLVLLQDDHAGVLSSFDIAQKVTDEPKLKVTELEREVDRQREVMVSDRAGEKREAIQVKETKGQDPDVLVKKISLLEEELFTVNTKLQSLTDENTKLKHDIHESESDLDTQNALVEAEKAKVVELQEQVSNDRLKIRIMGEELKAANDEISELKHELSSKSIELGSIQQEMTLLHIRINSQQAKILELQEEVNLRVADISLRDDQITELKSEVSLLKTSHSAKEDGWNNDIKRSKADRDGVKAQLDTLRDEACFKDKIIKALLTRLSCLLGWPADETDLEIVEPRWITRENWEVMSDRSEESD